MNALGLRFDGLHERYSWLVLLPGFHGITSHQGQLEGQAHLTCIGILLSGHMNPAELTHLEPKAAWVNRS